MGAGYRPRSHFLRCVDVICEATESTSLNGESSAGGNIATTVIVLVKSLYRVGLSIISSNGRSGRCQYDVVLGTYGDR